MKKFYIITFALLCNLACLADPIDEAKALEIAQQFYNKQTSNGEIMYRRSSTAKPKFNLEYVCKDDNTISSRGVNFNTNDIDNLYYVFNIEDNNGFVIVSGDDSAGKVLGYSTSGNFSHNNMPDNLKALMDGYKQAVKTVVSNGPTDDTTLLRKNVSTNLYPSKVLPLLEKEGISWGQNQPFNDMCPTDNLRKKSLTGCVATAIAQLIRYNKFPQRGVGSHQYNHKKLGNLYADFNTVYDWDNMPAKYLESNYSTEQAQEVAKLMYHIGVSVEMDYSSRGSSVYAGCAKQALINYFGYDEGIDYLKRSFYSQEEWYSIIKKELSEKRPLLYNGISSGGGHAFVCDGYDSEDLFHINWGWEGASNGYFDLAILKPSTQGAGGGVGGFSNDQGMLIGIQPPKETNNPNYNFHVTFDNITFPKTKIINRENPFTLIFYNIRNRSELAHDTFDFSLALKSESTTHIIHTETLNQFGNAIYYEVFDIKDLKIADNIPNGSYELIAQIKNPYSGEYIKVRSLDESYREILVDVSDTEIVFSHSNLAPKIKIVGNPQIGNGQFYTKEKGKISFTIKNEGNTVFRSKIEVVLTEIKKGWFGNTSLGKSTVVADVSLGIEAGESKTIDLEKQINLSPGQYSLDIRYASPNNEAGPTNKSLFNNFSVEIKKQPYLSIRLTNPKQNQYTRRFNKLSTSINIDNKGGFYSRDIKLEIYKLSNDGEYKLFKTINQPVTLGVRENKTFTFEINTDDFTDSKALKNELGKSRDVPYRMVFKYFSDSDINSYNLHDFFIYPAINPILSSNPKSFDEITLDNNGKLSIELPVKNSGTNFENRAIIIEFLDLQENVRASVENNYTIDNYFTLSLEENEATRALPPGIYTVNLLYENDNGVFETMDGKYGYIEINIGEPKLQIDNSDEETELEFNLTNSFTYDVELINKGGAFEGELYLDIIPSEDLVNKGQAINTIELAHLAPRNIVSEAKFTTKLDSNIYQQGDYTIQLKHKLVEENETVLARRSNSVQNGFVNIGEPVKFTLLDKNGNNIGIDKFEFSAADEFNIFQNDGNLEIQVPNNTETLYVYDITGRIYSKIKLDREQTEVLWDSSMLNKGVYLIVLEGSYGKIVKKVYIR